VKRIVLSFALALVMLGTAAVQAQEYKLKPTEQPRESKSTTRLEKQHKPSSFLKEHLKQTEESILQSLQTGNVGSQRSAIQTLRDLEQMFPEYPFSALLAPLEKILKDEKADSVSRRLAALALDELHSDAGDAVIQEVAGACDDKGLQTLCQALLVKRSNK
jgi:hypothetical protein